MTLAIETRLAETASAVDDELDRVLGSAPRPGETVRPDRLVAAMRHGVLAGGKRFRPFLLIEAARLIGGDRPLTDMLTAAAAIECLHCYSLIHDDLPAMDGDDMRRGRPTVHKAYDEATAILAGDGLLTLAFDLLADPACHADPAIRAGLVADLARASGIGGMVGGQMLDLAAEGRFADGPRDDPAADDVRRLQAMKTGALIRAACGMGARLGGGQPDEIAVLQRYGEIVGLAFQLADDLLDVTADMATLGKAAGKDAAHGKGTLVGLIGIDAVRAELDLLIEEASNLLAPWRERAAVLIAAARFAAERSR